MKKEKICIVTPILRHGGMERVVSELANYIVSMGYPVSIICLMKIDDYYYLDKRIELVKPGFEYKKGIINKARSFIFLTRSLIKIKPNAVLGFSEPINPLTIIASRVTFNKVYVSDRCSPDAYLQGVTSFLRKLSYPFAHGMIAQTIVAKKALISNGFNKNIVSIPNPLREINDTYPKLNGKYIVTACRLEPGKNIDILIDIFNALENADEWKLLILGDGSLRETLENKVKSLKLNDRVIFEGAVRDVDKYFAKASIFAFTSSSEGFPNALSEAMAFPLACISYDCLAGPSDIIKNEFNGVLIPVNDAAIFRKELQKLISCSELVSKYKSNALLNRDIFHHEVTSKKYLDFIIEKDF